MVLAFSSNMLCLEGGQALASSLAHLRLLSSLNLRDNKMGFGGYTAIVQCLRQHPHLKDFWLEKFCLEGHSNAVTCVAWSPDGTKVASGSDDCTIKIWNALTAELITTLQDHSSFVLSVVWSPDGAKLLSGGFGAGGVGTPGELLVCDGVSGRKILDLNNEEHIDVVSSATWSPDGNKIASAAWDDTVKIWNALTGQLLMTLEGHSHWVHCVVWSPDGSKVASAAWDETCKIWDALTGELITTLKGHSRYVECVAWSPDGTKIGSASHDKSVKIWDALTGALISTLTGHTGVVLSLQWCPDGTKVASASHDKTAIVWDPISGEQIATLIGHTGPLRGVAWMQTDVSGHSDAVTRTRVSMLVTGSDDMTLILWDGQPGQELSQFRGHES